MLTEHNTQKICSLPTGHPPRTPMIVILESFLDSEKIKRIGEWNYDKVGTLMTECEYSKTLLTDLFWFQLNLLKPVGVVIQFNFYKDGFYYGLTNKPHKQLKKAISSKYRESLYIRLINWLLDV